MTSLCSFSSQQLCQVAVEAASNGYQQLSGEATVEAQQIHFDSFQAIILFSQSDGGKRVYVDLRDHNRTLETTQRLDFVPKSTIVQLSNGLFARLVPIMEGRTWESASRDMINERQLDAAYGLGHLLARCKLEDRSDQVVEQVIIPKLDRIIASIIDEKAKDVLVKLRERVPTLKQLPLALCPMNINRSNLILTENDKFDASKSVVSWEDSHILPLGANLGVIRDVATDNDKVSNRTFRMTLRFMDGFSVALAEQNLSDTVIPNNRMELIETSAKVGKVMQMWRDESRPPNLGEVQHMLQLFGWYLRMLR